jgi:hypothetical protein
MPPFWVFDPGGGEGGYVPPSQGRGIGGLLPGGGK